MNQYVGHPSQLYGMEEHELTRGRGKGLRLIEIHNGKGLDLTVSPDRCADISRLRYKGINLSYMNPCGYVAPAFYDKEGGNFLNSFTAGFLTTCGLQNVGTPNTQNGVNYGLHGSIANTPCENYSFYEKDGVLCIDALVRDEVIFGRKMTITRKIRISTEQNTFEIEDTIVNNSDHDEPIYLLYHMNMGYPLLDEDSIVDIKSSKVIGRNQHASDDIKNWMHMEKPTKGYEERCYYHSFEHEGYASITQPKLGIKLEIMFDPKVLDYFTEWKMMGIRDYVLGLEPGNTVPDGRASMHERGLEKVLKAGEKKTYKVSIKVSG